MGLELNVVNESSNFNCNGSIKPFEGAKPIRCHKHSGHGSQTFVKALCNSCNPAFITLGQRIGAENFFKFYKDFGFHSKTGIDLPGESGDIFFSADGSMAPTDLCVASMGQNFSITPIQMITAAAAIANGGNLVQPHVVKEVLDENGNTVKKINPAPKRRVISKETARRVTAMLHENATNGAARNAYIPGYRVAGKTGTSQKIGLSAPGQMDYISSFCGFAPADDPKIVMLVFFDTPKGDHYYGAAVAAPAFVTAMQDILPYMGIEKVYSEEELEKINTVVPELIGKSVGEAKNTAASLSLRVVVVGNGDKVISQIPDPSSHIPKDGKIILHTDSSSSSSIKVPKLVGLTPAEVNKIASQLGLNINFSGIKLEEQGVASTAQSIPEGTEVPMGTVVTVNFIHHDSTD